MARIAAVFSTTAVITAIAAISACANNPYVIGRAEDAVAVDAGVNECERALSAALVCSGFEAELASDWSTSLQNQGALERSLQRAHSGSAALHASSTARLSTAVVFATFEPVTQGELYLRAHLYVPAELPTQTMNLFFIGAEPTPDPFTGIDFNLEDGAVQVFSPQSDPARQTSVLVIPRDQWFCFRARVAIGDSATVQAFIDDELAIETMPFDTLPDDGVHMLRAGVDWSSEQNDFFEVFIDDVALDTAPIDCL